MISLTSPLASSSIISMSLGVTAPSLSPKPSQVADRTNLLASLMPLIEVHSNNSAILIVLFVFLLLVNPTGRAIPCFGRYFLVSNGWLRFHQFSPHNPG